MIKISTLITIFFVFAIRAQERVTNLDVNSKLDSEYHSYPLFFGTEQHSSFKVNYKLNDNLQAELQGFYDTYLFENRFRSSIVLKQYLSKKLYVFGGVGLEMSILDDSRIISKPPRIGIVGGLGYDIKKNFSIEAKGDFSLNKNSIGAFGEPLISMPKIYTVQGKLKF